MGLGTPASTVGYHASPSPSADVKGGHRIVQFLIERVDSKGTGLCSTLTVADLAGHKPMDTGSLRGKQDLVQGKAPVPVPRLPLAAGDRRSRCRTAECRCQACPP